LGESRAPRERAMRFSVARIRFRSPAPRPARGASFEVFQSVVSHIGHPCQDESRSFFRSRFGIRFAPTLRGFTLWTLRENPECDRVPPVFAAYFLNAGPQWWFARIGYRLSCWRSSPPDWAQS
jgi:hypothetical protein